MKRTRLFSISRKRSRNNRGKQEYIELVDCPQNGISCLQHRKVINESMLTSREHLVNKDYYQSIKYLKTAFYKTIDLKKTNCVDCAKFFRSNILHSMENMHQDLEKISSGFFTSNRLKPHYEFATQTLEELKRDKD